jgi:hypothetical protein
MVNPAKARRVKTSAGFLFVVYLATFGRIKSAREPQQDEPGKSS